MSAPPADGAPPRAENESSVRARAPARVPTPASAPNIASASTSVSAQAAQVPGPTLPPISAQLPAPGQVSASAPVPAPDPALPPPAAAVASGASGDTAAAPAPPPAQAVATVQGFWRYGRYYGNWRPNQYLVPIDSEELSRLDLLHKFFSLARKTKLCHYPVDDNPGARVLDLGTGTGIWAVAMMQKNLDLEITAVDLNRIQPHMIPEGLHFLQYDLEEPSWAPRVPMNQDLIHVRQLFGSIRTELWPQFYANVFKHLLPGDGYFEQTEIDYTPRFATDEPPPCAATLEWVDRYLGGMDRANRSARVDSERTRRQLREAGFVDIREVTTRCCLSPWSDDATEIDAARWFNFGITNGLQGLGLIPMIDHGELNVPQVQQLCGVAEHEMCHLKYRMYMNMHTWIARRPADVRGPRQFGRALPVSSTSPSSAPQAATTPSHPPHASA